MASWNSFYPNTTLLFTLRSFKESINVGFLYQPKRSMIRSKLTQFRPTHLSSTPFKNQQHRFLPYKAQSYTKPESEDGIKLDDKHILLQDVDTSKIIGHLTSKKFNDCGKANIRINDMKYDGSYKPATDPRSVGPVLDDYGFKVERKGLHPKIIMDDYGYTVPSKIAGGQYLRISEIPKDVENPLLLKNAPPEVQKFVDANTDVIDKHVHASGVLNKNSLKIK